MKLCSALFAVLGVLAASLSAQDAPENRAALDGKTRQFSVSGTTTTVRLGGAAGAGTFEASFDGGRTFSAPAPVRTSIMLNYATFDPATGEPSVPEAWMSPPASRVHIVQFVTPAFEAYLGALRSLGAEPAQFLPYQSFLVRMDTGIVDAVRALPFVRWVGPFHPAYRLEPSLLAGAFGNDLPPEPAKYDISTLTRFGADQALLANAVEAAGGTVHTAPAGGYIVEAFLAPEQLRTIAGHDTVMSISRSTGIGYDIDLARIQGGANYLEVQKPEGYTGKGIRGHVIEGIHSSHVEFGANAWRSAPIVHINGTSSSHGTNTCGEIYSQGINPLYRGLLPDAQCMYTNYNAVYNNNNRYPYTQQLVDPNDIYRCMLQTASWGYSQTTIYTDRSREMDIIIFDFDMPTSQSQSNTGNQTSRPQAWAKNIFSVGGINHYGTTDPTDDRWSGASIGPATDGRIKPDLCAYYDGIGTTSGSTSYTNTFGGTSGATPIVNGHMGLALEMYTDGIFGHPMIPGGWQVRFENRPHSTTVKAILTNMARQYPMTQATITRYNQGWGFPNVQDIWDLRNRTHVVNEWDVLTALQTKTYYFYVAPGTPKFAATMVYLDPAAAANAVVHRINDVNLRVTAPNGTAYWGNNGLTASNWSTAGGTANDRDTVEHVFVQNPAAGIWVVEVTAAEINEDAHVETPAMDVDYALVASGIASGRDMTGMTLDTATTSGGLGDFSATLAGLPAGWTEGYTVFSATTSLPKGLGPDVGITIDALTLATAAIPAAPGGFFHFTPSANPAHYPNAAFTMPPGAFAAVAGQTFDAVAVVIGPFGVRVSNVDRVTF